MLEATIHGSREERSTALPPPPCCSTDSKHHRATGVDRNTHPHILLGPPRQRETPTRFSTSTEDREAGPDNVVVPLVSGSR